MKYHLKQASKQGLFLLILSLALLQSCSQKPNQSESPTAASASAKADSTSPKGTGNHKVVSSVSPFIQYFAKGTVVNGGTQWTFLNYVPATSHDGTYTILHAVDGSADQIAKLYEYYGFRRAIVTYPYVSEYAQAGFSENQLLVIIGYQGMDADWRTAVSTCTNQVLGYTVDEPSNKVTADSMGVVKNAISAVGSALWIDDYDTGVIPDNILLEAWHNDHIADWGVLYYADYLMCDADNAKDTNGQEPDGTYLAEDYNDFLDHPGIPGSFNTIYTMPPYENEADVLSWISSHTQQITNFALDLESGWTWNDVDNFAVYAYQAGFLGSYQQLEQVKYVCEQNNVGFSPGSGVAGSYYGILTNNSYYTGPVDPSTQGAVLCWQQDGIVPLSQYQTV